MVYTHHMRTSVTVVAVSVVVGVATTAAGPAFADDLGEVATSTFSYSSVDTTTGGVTTRSQPMTQLLTLTIREPEPEPEPEPVPEIVEEETLEAPVIAVSTQDAPRRDRKKKDIVAVELTPTPPAVAVPPLPIVEAQENADVVEEPDFQLQESAPATPLPVEPPRTDEAVAEDLAKPTTNIWSTWWLWVLGGLSLLWWAWLGWSARKNPAAQGM